MRNNVKLQVWDLGGQTSIRPYWRCYYEGTSAVVFVVDSADVGRMSLVQQELTAILEEDELKGVPLLVLANKSDLPNALKEGEIGAMLLLDKIRSRPWHIQQTSALRGEGLEEAFSW